MKHSIALAALLAAMPTMVSAQALQPVVTPAFVSLPTNTEVLVTLNDELNSKRAHKGQLFDVSVSRDVMADGRIVIPRGTPGRGEIVYRTGKGAFGKSGKMEVVLRSLDVNGRLLPVTGRFRQEGQGNTGAVLGTVVLAGVIAGAFVTGHSAVIEQGREFKAFTAEAFPLTAARQVAVAAIVPARPVTLAVVAPVKPTTAPSPVVIAVVRPTYVAPPTPRIAPIAYAAPSDPIADYQRRLAAQRGVHGRDPRQGWTISD